MGNIQVYRLLKKISLSLKITTSLKMQQICRIFSITWFSCFDFFTLDLMFIDRKRNPCFELHVPQIWRLIQIL